MSDISKTRSKSSRRAGPDVKTFQDWLRSLDLHVNPSIHINYGYQSAVVAVDFGSPLQPVKLSNDQTIELHSRIRKLTKEVIGKDINVRIMHDQSNGVYWSSL
jgi:hypothetical protein